MKPQRNVLLTTFFVVLSIVAIFTVVSLQQTPSQENQTLTVGTFTSTALYDYTAYVQSSLVYGNKTALKPQDGVLYTKLTDKIDVTLTYNFNTTAQTQPYITYYINETLRTAAWQHSISSTAPTTTSETTIQLTLPSFNRQELEQTKVLIDQETGVSAGSFIANSAPYYVLEIIPTFQVDTSSDSRPIHQIFQAPLLINATHTTEGDIIQIGPLTKTSSGSITQTQTLTNSNVVTQQYISYIFAATSFGGLGYMAFLYKKQKQTSPANPSFQKLLQPYRHLIVEATENKDAATTIIKVANVGELVKAAETLARPILHIKDAGADSLYVIEGNTKYQYRIESGKDAGETPN